MAMRRWQGPPPAERVRLPSSTQLQPPHKLHTPQPAPGCVAHKHTQWALLMAGDRHRSYRTAHARRAPTQRRHGGRFPARPRQPTAHNCMAHPAPHKTRQRHMHRHLRRPHRVAYTPVPSPLYPLAPLPTHGSKHAVQGRLATPKTPPSIIHSCVLVRTGTSLSIPPVTTCRTSVAGAYIGRQLTGHRFLHWRSHDAHALENGHALRAALWRLDARVRVARHARYCVRIVYKWLDLR